MNNTTIKHEKAIKASTWSAILTLLGFLVIIASIAYSTFKLKEKRAELEKLEQTKVRIEDSLFTQQQKLRASREAVAYVTNGINLYHQGRYKSAVVAYNVALSLDSLNAYILNLKGYSLFKAKQFDEAVEVLNKAVEVKPDYAWGYFDLARVNCANQNFDGASKAIRKAIELRPDLVYTMKNDQEFTNLCRPLLDLVK